MKHIRRHIKQGEDVTARARLRQRELIFRFLPAYFQSTVTKFSSPAWWIASQWKGPSGSAAPIKPRTINARLCLRCENGGNVGGQGVLLSGLMGGNTQLFLKKDSTWVYIFTFYHESFSYESFYSQLQSFIHQNSFECILVGCIHSHSNQVQWKLTQGLNVK